MLGLVQIPTLIFHSKFKSNHVQSFKLLLDFLIFKIPQKALAFVQVKFRTSKPKSKDLMFITYVHNIMSKLKIKIQFEISTYSELIHLGSTWSNSFETQLNNFSLSDDDNIYSFLYKVFRQSHYVFAA